MFRSLRAQWARNDAARQRAKMGIILKSREEIEQMRVFRVEEVVERHVEQAPVLELGVFAGIRCHEGRRADGDQVLREPLLICQLFPGDAHELDRHTGESDIAYV